MSTPHTQIVAKKKRPINVLAAQFPVGFNIQNNVDIIRSILDKAQAEDLVIFPEGAVSGYSEDPAFLNNIDKRALSQALHTLQEDAAHHRAHIILGSCVYENGNWYNAGIYYGANNTTHTYHKINLAARERGYFTAGESLPVFSLTIGHQTVKIGMQLCREIRFPEQFRYLARSGAEVFICMVNAVGDAKQADVWRSHLISRAAENQRFVLSSNNAHTAQKCPTMIIAPNGEVLWETQSAELAYWRFKIDLSSVSNWYLSQARKDIINDAGYMTRIS